MQAIILTDIKKLELRDIPSPKITSDKDILLKTKSVGVCGSDVHYYETGRIGSQVVQFPFIVGHECSAIVTETGKGVTRVKVGDMVAVDPAMVCHECDQCRQGRENTCRNLRFLGCPGQADGCLSEYFVMPEDSLFPLHGKITSDQAVLSEPLSIAVYAVKQSQFSPSANIAVLGAGPIGLGVMAAAQFQGINDIYMTDRIDDRVLIAQKAHARWCGNPDGENIVDTIMNQQPAGIDAVFECAGQQDALDQALDLLKPGGKLMLIGIPREERISFIIDRLRRKEITLINVRRQNNCVQPAIDMIAAGRVDVDYMVTHRFRPEQAQEAFDMVAGYEDGVIKALIDFHT